MDIESVNACKNEVTLKVEPAPSEMVVGTVLILQLRLTFPPAPMFLFLSQSAKSFF